MCSSSVWVFFISVFGSLLCCFFLLFLFISLEKHKTVRVWVSVFFFFNFQLYSFFFNFVFVVFFLSRFCVCWMEDKARFFPFVPSLGCICGLWCACAFSHIHCHIQMCIFFSFSLSFSIFFLLLFCLIRFETFRWLEELFWKKKKRIEKTERKLSLALRASRISRKTMSNIRSHVHTNKNRFH